MTFDATLQAEADRRAEAADLVLGLTRHALTAPDLPSAVQPILRTLLAHTAAVGAAYFQLSDTTLNFHARVADGEMPDSEMMRAVAVHGLPDKTPLLQALRHQQAPLFFDDTTRAPEAAGFFELGVLSVAAAPVCDAQGRLLGTFLMHTFDRHEWRAAEAELFATIAGTLAILTARLAAEEQLQAAHEAALRALGLALETRDGETYGHIDRVTALALRLGNSMGLSAGELQSLRWGAYLHDIGKLAVPDAVLLKPGKLDAQEWQVMRSHVEEGERFARTLGFLPQAALGVITAHHERWDGGGYPHGLSGESISLPARIFAVCDVYDALTSKRPYKVAWSQSEALAEIRAQAGRQFEPQVVQHLLSILEEETPLTPSA
ncbi:HD domain-containing phosphohydrolase [Deinococcus peraridilitoris]|uniref:Putative domain HDIG-containing protein n=1 Tax=Deinococcus peraridilitoris (strain DSM 19664 / LMG 22246 / CIP 109416 / KR-200) TaxID=937777 RepID=L0A0C3_DEIPD|nr:HD domain-containing phosphohydrolase [Deinococcus peraridilitoris]AFZ66597.1 putative domain HDIG-containing protein [Deinococcus peraridilitoris DSM 19664]